MRKPMRKLPDSSWPNIAYDMSAVKAVAMVLLYFLRMVSANL